jgi:hypothetical protein
MPRFLCVFHPYNESTPAHVRAIEADDAREAFVQFALHLSADTGDDRGTIKIRDGVVGGILLERPWPEA